MTPYKNINGDSNIEAYEINSDSIRVTFKSGKHRNYLYNNEKQGSEIVNNMKKLAVQGYGLNSYISRVVRSEFYKKW